MSKSTYNVILVGPMGAGKSTIGKRLAGALGKRFVDCDRAIEEHTGAGIPLIFDIEGEAGFRQREKDMLEELATRENLVLATGGGAVLDPANRATIRQAGTVVYLACSVEQQYARTRHSKHRPLLQTADPVARLRDLFQEREPLYRAAAHLVMNTEHRSVKSVVKELTRILQSGKTPHDAGPARQGE